MAFLRSSRSESLSAARVGSWRNRRRFSGELAAGLVLSDDAQSDWLSRKFR